LYKSQWFVGRGGSLVQSRSSRHVGTWGKSFIHLWRFGVELQHSNRDVSRAPLRSSGLKRRYRNAQNEWMYVCMYACAFIA